MRFEEQVPAIPRSCASVSVAMWLRNRAMFCRRTKALHENSFRSGGAARSRSAAGGDSAGSDVLLPLSGFAGESTSGSDSAGCDVSAGSMTSAAAAGTGWGVSTAAGFGKLTFSIA